MSEFKKHHSYTLITIQGLNHRDRGMCNIWPAVLLPIKYPDKSLASSHPNQKKAKSSSPVWNWGIGIPMTGKRQSKYLEECWLQTTGSLYLRKIEMFALFICEIPCHKGNSKGRCNNLLETCEQPHTLITIENIKYYTCMNIHLWNLRKGPGRKKEHLVAVFTIHLIIISHKYFLGSLSKAAMSQQQL